MEKKLSRRQFIKSMAAGAAGVAAFGVVDGLNLKASAEGEAIYTPGTYSASAWGMSSDVTVTLTFDETSIIDAAVDVSGETQGIGAAIGDQVVEQLLAGQTAEIDGVTGASLTSTAVRTAARECIDQAKGIVDEVAEAAVATAGQHSWEVKPEPIPESEIVETVDTEILVIGGGYAGCATAARAAELGAKVILVEKSDTLHGNGVGGTGAVASKALDAFDLKLDKVDSQKRWVKTCGGRCRESLVAKFHNTSEEAMNWMIDIAEASGAQALISENHSNDPVHKEDRTYHMFVGGSVIEEYGFAVFAPHLFRLHAEENGAQFVYNSPAEQLVQDESGAVTGAICKTDAGYVKYNASKGVVLATGDISFNEEMMEYFAPIGNKVLAKLNGALGDTGDGINMACWAGAAVQDGPWPTMMHPQAASYWHGPFLFVTPEGKRYMNEATWVQGKCIGLVTQAKSPYSFSIFDSKYPEYVLQSLPSGGGMFWDNFRFIGSTFEDSVETTVSTIESGVENDPKNYFKADTLEELAEKIGVPTDALLATVEHYNELCDKGEDTDFYKDQVFLTPIKEGPFYATRVGAGLLAVVGGLHIDDNNQVCTANDEAIPGLFAVGNVSGDMYAVDYPINFMGNSHGRCLVGGYSVGTYLANL
ncbi:MAG: FAD-dependent oxidoreductase [Oscillospiraceae bacterium]|nr:FAD-dependent oxidoreductase [Oscillospiraceae bacterium]